MRLPRSDWSWIQCKVALVLLLTYAYFWHARDWNTSSRLLLTYAMVDRETVCLDGLDRQTGDIAHFRGHYYCDKLPGFSLWGALPYGLARLILRLPPHPLDAPGVPAMPHWPADYWITLGSSGLFSILTSLLVMRQAAALGCCHRRAALLGLAYGLGTPAQVYATLAYGHQLSAFALFASFHLLSPAARGRSQLRLAAAGFLAAYAAVVELQVGPVAAILGLYLLFRCARGYERPDALGLFAVGAAVPTLLLLGYNLLAFGSPWDMGYFHHATEQFARVHSRGNPLGLRRPDPALISPLLWGEYRGLFFYAPILILAIPGWILLLVRRRTETAVVTFAAALAVFVVNLSYPEWTGGWSTGPRLLVPLLPFAMVPVAAVVANDVRGSRWLFRLAIVLALAGAGLMLLFQGVGGRIPQFVALPLRDAVWPLWSGAELPKWWPADRATGERFARNLCSLAARDWLGRLPAAWRGLQFAPLVLLQAACVAAIAWKPRRPPPAPAERKPA